MKNFKFSYLLLGIIASHSILLALFFNAVFFIFGGHWVFYLGAIAAVAGVVIPFFLKADPALKWLNLLPGLAFLTGWGSWIWLLLIDAQGPVINIWGIFGPALGVFTTIIFYIGVLIAGFQSNQKRSDSI